MSQNIGLENIENLVREGRHRPALKLLRQLEPKQKSNFLISDLYFRCGAPHEALMTLGAEDPQETPKTYEQLTRRARLAFMLSYFDANETALRLLQSALRALPQIPSAELRFAAILHKYAATIYLRQYDYESALVSYRMAQRLEPDKNGYSFHLLKLGEADCVDHLGDFARSNRIATQLLRVIPRSQPVLRAIALQARGEYCFRQHDNKRARMDFDAAWKLFPSDSLSHDYGFLAKWSGALAIRENNFARAQRELDFAQKLFSNQRIRPAILLEVFHWQIVLDPAKLQDPLYRLVLTHPTGSPFGIIWGRPKRANENIETWIQSQASSVSEPTWCLTDKFRLVDLTHQFLSLQDGQKKLLDLQSGFLWENQRVKGRLSDLHRKCLQLLYGAGEIGLNMWSLTEKLYPGQWTDPTITRLRTENLLHELRAKGYDLDRREGQITLTRISNPILVPFSQGSRSIWPVMRIIRNIFTRKQLANIYSCSDSTAKIWIEQGLRQGILRKIGQGRNVQYYLS